MGTTTKHLTLSGLAGGLLAAVGWLLWWLGSRVLGASDVQLHTLWLALGVGTASAALAGAVLSLVHRRAARKLHEELANAGNAAESLKQDVQALQKRLRDAKPPKRKKRHPLERGTLRASWSSAPHWQKVSRSLRALLGVSADEMLGKPIFRMVHPEDVPDLDKAIEEARKTRAVIQAVCRFVAVGAPSSADHVALTRPLTGLGSPGDTNELPALSSSAVIHLRVEIWAKLDRAGKVTRFDCQFVDLTPQAQQHKRELRTARKEMASLKKRGRAIGQDLSRLKLSYHELYHNAPVMYFSINTEGKLVTFNETLLRTLGYQRDELKGRSYTDLLAPATLKNYINIAQNMPWQEGELETQWRKKDGTLIDIWLNTVPVHDDQGHFARYRSAALELTEKNRLANELRSRGDELERTNQRLRLINTELEEFTHVVSHDLKEPLRTLQAYSHILAEEHAAQLGPDGFQYINHLIRASRRLGILIDELLNLSQAGRITRAPQACSMIEIVATVRQDLVDLLQRKQATLAADGSLPNIVGDPVRITQLVANLVGNGLKYNQSAAPQVTIGSAQCPDDPSRVAIFVRDNGIGIDPAFHEQIFGIFRRLHQTDEYEGTGAGLAICKKIVEGHGGRMWIESQLGAGATFFFTLPRAPVSKADSSRNGAIALERKTEASPSSASQRKMAEAGSGVALTTSPRIVLVEDQPEVGMIIQKLGKRDKLTITWFPTAEEAWQHLQKEGADLLLLDINLPGMNGIELCRRVRTLAHLRETPVAIFTPEHEPEQLQELRDAGADFFLSKDLLCNLTSWQQKIQELLEQIRQPVAH